MIDCRLCTCHTVTGNCTKDAHQEKVGGELVGITRCRIHDKTTKTCPYYMESEYSREYYKEHPLSDLP